MRSLFLSLLVIGITSVPAVARAQHAFEAVGERALGMAGAFVAVADDASAAWWNPAGLVAGQPFGATIEWTELQIGNQDISPFSGAGRRTSSFAGFGSWPLGLSRARVTSSWVNTGADGSLQVTTLETTQYGATILQSVAQGLVVGATLKYLRGGAVSGPPTAPTAGDALVASADIDRDTSGAFDLDVGVMADFVRARVGVTVRNLREPEFGGPDESAIRLSRQARLGLSARPVDGLTLAMDIDLNAVDLGGMPRRVLAVGGEVRPASRLALRAGVRRDLEESSTLVGATGASVALRSGLWLDAHYADGRSAGDREVGLALRAGF